MKRFLSMYAVEQKQFFRSLDVIIFNLCMPAVTLFVIAMIAGNGGEMHDGLTMLESSYASLTTVGICCNAFMSIPITIVQNREAGILRRMYCSPCSAVRILACDVISCAVMAVLSTLIVTVLAVVAFGYRMAGSILLFGGMWFLTMCAMFSIGLLAAGLCRTVKSMNIVTSVLYFPSLLFSGAMIPTELFPEGMRLITKWMPLGVGVDALKHISAGMYEGLAVQVVVLSMICVVCALITVKTFRWE
ncbi:MAG: ABC transporter permease [Bulleidia sp.]